MKYSTAVEDYFQSVIKNSWTWEKLTEEERKRFIDMNVFDQIKGNDQTRKEWMRTIYEAFLVALGYEPVGWRGTAENILSKKLGEWYQTKEQGKLRRTCSECGYSYVIACGSKPLRTPKYCSECGKRMSEDVVVKYE